MGDLFRERCSPPAPAEERRKNPHIFTVNIPGVSHPTPQGFFPQSRFDKDCLQNYRTKAEVNVCVCVF